jgi:hypothetical protein
VLPSADALELALGVGLGVAVVADAMPAKPMPAASARAAPDMPRVIFFVGFISCLLIEPSPDGRRWGASWRDIPSIGGQLQETLLRSFRSPVNPGS